MRILFPLSLERCFQTIILVLLFTSYGQFWNRGGYADDFAFLAYVTPQSYWDAVSHWAETFNSRIAQGVLMPLLMKGLAGATPAEFHWGVFHLIGISFFGFTLYFLDRTLRLFSIAWPVRLVICLIFALNPIKNEALLWPATIVGYIIPVCFFSLACWLYLAIQNCYNQLEIMRVLPFVLVLFSVLAIEQLLPVFIILIAMRFLFLPSLKKELVIDSIFTLVMMALFAAVTLAGKTTDRAAPFLSVDLLSIAGRFVSVTLESLKDILGYSFSVLLDPFYWRELMDAALSPEYFAAITTLAILLWFLAHRSTVSSFTLETRQLWGLGLTGAVVWLASLSPFIILSYYLPPRTLYLPSFGIALVGGAALTFVLQRVHTMWMRATIMTGLVTVYAVFILINIYSQHDFSQSWNNEQKIIHYVSSIEEEEIPDGIDVSIFNIPVGYGPSPGFVNNFSMNGIVNWFLPGRSLSGSTRNDISDVLEWSDDLTRIGNSTLFVRKGYWFLLWTSKGVARVQSLGLSIEPSGANCSELRTAIASGSRPIALEFVVKPVRMQSLYGRDVVLHVGGYLHNRCLDLGIIETFIDIPNQVKRNPKLYLHAVNTDGTTLPYDLAVAEMNGFRKTERGYRKYIFIKDFSSVSTLKLSLEGLGEKVMIEKSIVQHTMGNKEQNVVEDEPNHSPRISFF